MEKAQLSAQAHFSKHEKHVAELNQSVIEKLSKQAESLTGEATKRLRRTLEKWQAENQKKVQFELRQKVDDILGNLTDDMNRQAEATLSSIAAEVQEKAGKMMEESARNMRSRFTQLLFTAGSAPQEPTSDSPADEESSDEEPKS